MTLEIFDIVNYKGFENIDKIPEPTVPYFLAAEEGNYMHRRTAIGDVLAKDYTRLSRYLDKSGLGDGLFTWKGERVPGKIIAQATAWFRHIYQKQGTEAEVILTKKNDTDEWKIFVPFQRANHSGVHSIFDPTHIKSDWLIVGSIHSHCNFSAFHSGTDSGDAAKMDGVHFTIGMLTRDVPEIVSMVTMAGKEYHFKNPADIAEIQFDGETVPAWWDNMMLTNPKEKPKGLTSITAEQWNAFLGHSVSEVKQYQGYTPGAYSQHKSTNQWENRSNDRTIQRWKGSETIQKHETKSEKRRRLRQEGNMIFQELLGFGTYIPGFKIRKVNDVDARGIDLAIDLAVAADLISDNDLNDITAETVANTDFWKKFFQEKIDAAVECLDALGINMDYSLTPKVWGMKGAHK